MVQLEQASKMLDDAKAVYLTAILNGRASGLSNVAIGRAVGRTEAAVRMFIKRKTTKE